MCQYSFLRLVCGVVPFGCLSLLFKVPDKHIVFPFLVEWVIDGCIVLPFYCLDFYLIGLRLQLPVIYLVQWGVIS